MNREEALEKFRGMEAEKIFVEARKEYYEKLIEKRDEFAKKLRYGFHMLAEELQKREEDFALSCIHFSFLRVHITDGTYHWMVEAQDEDGVFTKRDISVHISMRTFFATFEKCREALYREAARYVNILTPSDCDELILQEFTKQVPYLYILGIYAFHEIEKDEVFQRLNKTDVFHITLGERRDKSFIIHMTRKNAPKQEEVLEKITGMPSEEDYSSREFMMHDFSKYKIEDCRIAFRNLVFGDFRECQVAGVELLCCKCMGTDWRGCRIEDSSMDLCSFQNATFEGAYIANSSMAGCGFEVSEYTDEVQKNIAMIPVSFRNAVIRGVDFGGSNMAGCDFRGAKFDNATFLEVNLKGACFDLSARDTIEFSEEQIASIHWQTDK